MFKQSFFLICILGTFVSLAAEVELDIHVKNLSSGTEAEKIAACDIIGREKKYISEIQDLLKRTSSPRVAVACANSLGYIQEKNSIASLKSKIMSESNSDVVYVCLLSILNISIKNGYDSDARYAVQYSDIHHRQDEFVADLIDRIKKKFKE